MKNKGKRSMKLIAEILIVILFVYCLTACQPTPQKSAVVGKDMQNMLSQAMSYQDSNGSLKERLNVPERCQAAVQSGDGKFKASVDADIVLPDADSIPIVRVEGQPFNQETVEKIKNIFFDDGKYYDPDALSGETKAELTDALVQLKQRRSRLKQQGMSPLHPELDNGGADETADASGSPESSAPGNAASMSAYNPLDQVNESIAFIEKMLSTASDQRKLVEVSGAPEVLPMPDGLTAEQQLNYKENPYESLRVAQINPKGGMRTLIFYSNEQMSRLYYASRRDNDPSYGFYFSEDDWNSQNPDYNPADIETAKDLRYPTMSTDQAQRIADDFLKQAGIQDFVCERCDKVIGGSGQTWANTVRRGNLLKAYELQYVRKVNGVPVTCTDVECASGGMDSQARLWYYERITFVIDDGGIVELKWNAPYRILDTLVHSASMLPFEQIEDIFKKKIVTANAWTESAEVDMNITEVRLGLMRVTEQNNNSQGLLVPVWDFFGTFTQITEQDGKRFTQSFGGITYSFLTVNAVDGSIIDRNKGF